MSRIVFLMSGLVVLSSCVVTAHHRRPAWSPTWSAVRQEKAVQSALFNVIVQLYDDQGSPLPGGEVIAVPLSTEARPPWSLKTSEYLKEHGAELRLSAGTWRIDVKPHAGIRPVSRRLVVKFGASYRVDFYSVFDGGATIQ